MAQSTYRSKRKASGGRYHAWRDKKSRELASGPTFTKLGKLERRIVRTRGGHQKARLLQTNEALVADKTGKVMKTEMVTVVENPSNPHLVRRNVITKGAVVETKLGKARITSRPGQEGSVHAVLME